MQSFDVVVTFSGDCTANKSQCSREDPSDDAVGVGLPWGKLQWLDLVIALPEASGIDWTVQTPGPSGSSSDWTTCGAVPVETMFPIQKDAQKSLQNQCLIKVEDCQQQK